mmetsp:Transcript_56497/g.89985  ORF Transcript_56497/g.89985 Transcript_56497/m.89985 type:complete len:249 (-) Transcript_56497:10-756(-)
MAEAVSTSPLDIEDILYYLFHFCHPMHLLSKMTRVCKHWNASIVNYKYLWTLHCNTVWTGKLYILPKAAELHKTSPLDAYKISCIDKHRNVITLHELVSIKWQFRFKWDMNPLHAFSSDSDTATGETPLVFSNFREDGSLIHEPYQGHFHWTFVKKPIASAADFASLNALFGDDHDTWNTTEEEGGGELDETHYGWNGYVPNKMIAARRHLQQSRWIQVNHFPPLCASRNASNWGWILQNEFVLLTSY